MRKRFFVFLILLIPINVYSAQCKVNGEWYPYSDPICSGNRYKKVASIHKSDRKIPLSFSKAVKGLPELTEVVIDKSADCKIELKVYNTVKVRCKEFLSTYRAYEPRKDRVLSNDEELNVWINKNPMVASKMASDMKKVNSNTNYILSYINGR